MIKRTGMGFDETKQEPPKRRVVNPDEKRRLVNLDAERRVIPDEDKYKKTGKQNETNTVIKTGMKDEPPTTLQELDNLPRNQVNEIEIPERPGEVRINDGTTEANVPVTGELENIKPVPVKEVNYNTNTSPLPIIKKISKETKDIFGSAKKTVRKVETGLGNALEKLIPSIKPERDITKALDWELDLDFGLSKAKIKNVNFAIEELKKQGIPVGASNLGVAAFFGSGNRESKFSSDKFDTGWLFMVEGPVGLFHLLGPRKKQFLINQFGNIKILQKFDFVNPKNKPKEPVTIGSYLNELQRYQLTQSENAMIKQAIVTSVPDYNRVLIEASIRHMIMEVNGHESTAGSISNGLDNDGKSIRDELRKILYGQSNKTLHEQSDYVRKYYERPQKKGSKDEDAENIEDRDKRRKYSEGFIELFKYLENKKTGLKLK